jgi:hypothetical protein
VTSTTSEVVEPSPVFVDESGRRGRRLRGLGWAFGVAFVGVTLAMVSGLLGTQSDAPSFVVPAAADTLPPGQYVNAPLPAPPGKADRSTGKPRRAAPPTPATPTVTASATATPTGTANPTGTASAPPPPTVRTTTAPPRTKAPASPTLTEKASHPAPPPVATKSPEAPPPTTASPTGAAGDATDPQ